MLPKKKILKFFSQPLVILFFMNLMFFYNPIFNNLYFSPADILQRFPSFNLGEFYSPKNSILFDVVTQFHPWNIFEKQNILNGNFPLWNPNNAGGVPHFANAQSAILFPLSIFYYFFNIKNALFLFHFTKLYLMGVFTYFYLKELGLKQYSSLIGAVAFNFALFNITWLMWPHTNVIIFLPLNFLLIERYLNNKTKDESFLILMSLSFAFSVFAGHPESLLHISVITLAYFLFSLFVRYSSKKKSIKLKYFSLSAIFGILLSSIQLIPFVEYLMNSYALHGRGTEAVGKLMPIQSLIYSIYPNISGNPSTGFYRPLFENTSYHESTGAYAGPIILFLSIISLLFVKQKRKLVLFFLITSLGCIPFIYKTPIFHSFAKLSNVYSANTRLILYLAFSQSILAALALDNLSGKEYVNSLVNRLIVIIPFFTLVIFTLVHFFRNTIDIGFDELKFQQFINYEMNQIIYMSLTFILGLWLISKIYLDNTKKLYYILLSFVIFAQTGMLNIKFNPSIEDKYFYPLTDEIKYLQKNSNGKFLPLGGNYIIPPDVNLLYQINSLENYDAMDIKIYKELYNQIFENRYDWNHQIINTEQKYLDLFGVQYVGSYTDADNKLYINQGQIDHYLSGLRSVGRIDTEFTSVDDNLYAVRVLPANFNRLNLCEIKVTIHQELLLIHEEIINCENFYDKIYYDIRFAPQDDSNGKLFNLRLEYLEGDKNDDVTFWINNQDQLVLHTLYQFESDLTELNLVHSGSFNIYENNNFRGDFWFIQNTVHLDEDEVIDYIKSDNFDVNREVVFIGGNNYKVQKKDVDASAEVVKIEQTPNRYRLRVNANKKGYLVSNKAYFPGWKARIDGKQVDVLRGNYAFATIPIQEGEHIVEYYYDPISVKIGTYLSSASLVFLLVAFGKSRKHEEK